MADVAHPPQHDHRSDQAAQPADQHRDQQAVPEELVLHRLGEPAHDATRSAKGPCVPASATSKLPVVWSRTTRISALKVRLRIASVKTFVGHPCATIP